MTNNDDARRVRKFCEKHQIFLKTRFAHDDFITLLEVVRKEALKSKQ